MSMFELSPESVAYHKEIEQILPGVKTVSIDRVGADEFVMNVYKSRLSHGHDGTAYVIINHDCVFPLCMCDIVGTEMSVRPHSPLGFEEWREETLEFLVNNVSDNSSFNKKLHAIWKSGQNSCVAACTIINSVIN